MSVMHPVVLHFHGLTICASLPRSTLICGLVARDWRMVLPITEPDAHMVKKNIGDTYGEGQPKQTLRDPKHKQAAVPAEQKARDRSPH